MADTDANELRQLDSMIRSLSAIRGLPLGKVIRNAARDMTKGMFYATPVAKITKSPLYWLKNPRTGSPRWVNRTTYGKNGPPRPHPKWRKVSKGYAKSSWITALRNLGVNQGSEKSYPSAQKESFAEANASDTVTNPYVRMVDALSYLKKLDDRSNMVQSGIRRAETNILKALTMEFAKAARKEA